jgi:hypothetical protein
MLTGRMSLGAAVVDDVIYAVGGAPTMGSGGFLSFSTNESLSTPPFEDLATNQGSNGGATARSAVAEHGPVGRRH